jgi:hypothetical protein
MRAFLAILAVLGLGTLAAGGAAFWFLGSQNPNGPIVPFVKPFGGSQNTYETEYTDYKAPPADNDDLLTDDRLEDKKPTPFDPNRVDRRPEGRKGEWLVNSSAAVLRLDVPIVKPDAEAYLLTLHPSYAAAARSNPYPNTLPSVNLLDGKAKQFDDGLYAALDQAYYQGLEEKLHGHVQLVRRLFDKVGKDSPAAPFLAAGLELAGVHVEAADRGTKERLLANFKSDEVASKAIGFYTWSEPLGACFRFLRFFQTKFEKGSLTVPLALARALADDPALLADYRQAMVFYSKLTNPYSCLSMADLVGFETVDVPCFVRICKEKKVHKEAVALFPPSTSRETVLFDKLFPLGVPPNVELMRELVRRIRSGEVNLQPTPASGWYEHQVFALETLLLPEKGEERDKLVLTKTYKKRMLEAFKALMTKRRETHVRQLENSRAPTAMPPQMPEVVSPRLRVEPCPTYYLRTARAYAFLANFLEASVGEGVLKQLHGLKKGGQRAQDLYGELHGMRDLFYGLYLVSAEDIGLAPALTPEENVDPEGCYKLAADWLPKALKDEDLAADTRVSVPIFVDEGRGVTRLWVTLGVRLARLEANYARPPSLKPAKGEGEWQVVEASRLSRADYIIPVDEFAEVELRGTRSLTREELRAICDREKTKEAILQALRR